MATAPVHESGSSTSGSDLFSQREVHEFQEDDAKAGKVVGRLLCTLFGYSLLVMLYIIWWTYHAVSH